LHEGSPRLLAAGVAMASGVMFLGVCAIVLVLKANLLVLVAPPLLAATAAAVLNALIAAYWRRSDGPEAQEFKFRNPFAFWTVVGFALFLGAVIVVGRVVGERLGGLAASAPLSVPPSSAWLMLMRSPCLWLGWLLSRSAIKSQRSLF
jgi:uncharacterized membrane protein (DUF4010 family)